MSESTDASHSPTLPLPPPKNTFQRIIGVIVSPGETFEDIARKPNVLMPMLLFIVISYVTAVFTIPRVDWESMQSTQIEQMKAKNPNMSQADIDRVTKMMGAVGKVMGWVGPILGIVWWVILAAVLFLAFRLFGGQGTFMQAWSTVLYAWVPMVINGIIITIVVVARGVKFDPTQMATIVKSNPAFLVDPKEHAALFALLSSFDIFTIWMVVLLIIGFATFSKTSRAKAATIIVSLWAVLILIKTALAAFGAARMKVKSS